ncbi:MAG: hypothetical protein DWH73_03125 [Planctomycetota bacterium]|nr:MAG: hypothetical protein DWH73_03125 [Planctomycetota bacterium]
MDRRHQSENLIKRSATLGRHNPTRCFALVWFLCPVIFSGCSTAPKSFLSMSDPAAINRARAVAFGRSEPDSTAIPILINRLSDNDPVVRLTSHEALKKRTGQDFGYQPYAEGDELSSSVGRWQAWWSASQSGRMFAGSKPLATPQASEQISPRQFKIGPRPLSEASYREKRGLFQRLFRPQ